jgi:hypothetical protein
MVKHPTQETRQLMQDMSPFSRDRTAPSQHSAPRRQELTVEESSTEGALLCLEKVTEGQHSGDLPPLAATYTSGPSVL